MSHTSLHAAVHAAVHAALIRPSLCPRQAREPKKEARRFINDTVRNDFHRKFLYRYVK